MNNDIVTTNIGMKSITVIMFVVAFRLSSGGAACLIMPIGKHNNNTTNFTYNTNSHNIKNC